MWSTKTWCVVTTFYRTRKEKLDLSSFLLKPMALKKPIHGLMSIARILNLFNTLLEKIVRSITLIMFQQFCVSL
jgi:hypothetical protein